MKLSVTRQKIILSDKSYNLEDVDFIMLDKKIRLYKSNGSTIVLNGGYDYYECVDTFWDIAFAVVGIDSSFIIVKDRVVNLSNIKNIQTRKGGIIINTLGFELQFTDLSLKETEILINKVQKNKLNIGTAI
jgi:hypothetical protein